MAVKTTCNRTSLQHGQVIILPRPDRNAGRGALQRQVSGRLSLNATILPPCVCSDYAAGSAYRAAFLSVLVVDKRKSYFISSKRDLRRPVYLLTALR